MKFKKIPLYPFRSLGPETEPDNYNEYDQIFFKTIYTSGIDNIAVMGPYGAGKSSLINSFLKKYDSSWLDCMNVLKFDTSKRTNKFTRFWNDKIGKIHSYIKGSPRYIKVSLLSLDQLDSTLSLEHAILQRIIYSRKACNTPGSRIQRICNPYSVKDVFFNSFHIVFGASFLLLLLFCNKVNAFLSGIGYGEIVKKSSDLFLMIVYELAICFKCVFSIHSFLRLKQVKIANNVIQFDSIKCDLKLNNYLDELLYFFQQNDEINLIAFEDLDRFENAKDIFTQLRDINIFLNSNLTHSVKFLYAIKDDLFDNKEEKTKFFDFIIPVVPVAGSTNSSVLMKQMLAEHFEVSQGLSDGVDVVALFITNMRILKSLVNEYVIFSNQTKHLNLDQGQLLGFVSYKLFYPEDFIKLTNNKGVLYSLVNSRDLLVRVVCSDLLATRNEISFVVDELKKSHCRNIGELKKMYVETFIRSQNNIDGFSNIQYNNTELYELFFGSFDSFFVNSQELRIGDNLYSSDMKEIQRCLGFKLPYDQHAGYLKDGLEKCVNDLLYNISNLDKQEESIRLLSFSSLAKQANWSEYCSSLIKNDKLKDDDVMCQDYSFLRALINNNLLTEMYTDYITYFYESKTFTNNDKLYMTKVYSNDTEDQFYFKIDNPEKIVSSLQPHHLQTHTLLNFSLFEYFASLSYNWTMHEVMIKDIIQANTNNVGYFFDRLYAKSAFPWIVLDIFSKTWTSLVAWLPNAKIVDKDELFVDYLVSSSITTLQFQTSGSISEYMSSFDNVLKAADENDIKVADVLKNFPCRIKNLNAEQLRNIPQNTVKVIVDENMYEISINNIQSLYSVLHLKTLDRLSCYMLFTLFLKSTSRFASNILRHIENNMNEFILNVIFVYEKNLESEEAMLLLVQKSFLTGLQKQMLLQSWEYSFKDISKLPLDDWGTALLLSAKIHCNWPNIIFVANWVETNSKQIDLFVSYLESNYLQLNSKRWYLYDITFDDVKNLQNQLVKFKIRDEIYTYISRCIISD